MKLTFFGADQEVTGSCHFLQVQDYKILIDCGLQQGEDEKENNNLPFNAADLDCVIVTHAHIDHSGRLPLLIKNGFRGKIYATRATCDLLSIMLLDSAHIQEMDAAIENRKGKRAGREVAEPIYSMQDAQNTLNYLTECEYEQRIKLSDHILFQFIDAGHLLGSSSIEMWLEEDHVQKKVVFSGDIGNKNQPIIRDPQTIKQADYVIMESTYGNKEHEKTQDYTPELAKIIDDTLSRGGNVVIPCFAVGRTQEILYAIREMKEKKLVKNHPDFPVYVDSPLAAKATEIYSGDLTGYADESTVEIIRKGFEPIKFSNLNICETTEESMSLNEDKTPKVIISSSGMCEAGRIRHHLKHNLWREESSILFVGYQANGTLGRMLIDGINRVKLFGEEITVQAQIYNFRGLSAHADRNGLIQWVSAFEKKPQRVFLVHGEPEACASLQESLEQLNFEVTVPNYQAQFDLITGQLVYEGISISEAEKENIKKSKSASQVSMERLLRAIQKLSVVAQNSKKVKPKILDQLAQQILSLCDKWNR